jgi:hypothetical protein
MVLSRRRVDVGEHEALSIDNEQLEEMNSIKYMGVKLNFKEHLALIVKKIAKKIGFLERISRKLTSRTKIMIYKSIIQPHIDDCFSIIFMENEGEMRSLKKARRTHIRWMLDVLGYHSIKLRVNFNTLILIFKIKNNLHGRY